MERSNNRKSANSWKIPEKLSLRVWIATTEITSIIRRAEKGSALEVIDRPIYHYTTVQAAKEILLSGRLMMSNPERFNDPFDLNDSILSVHGPAPDSWTEDYYKNTLAKEREYQGLTYGEIVVKHTSKNLKTALDYVKSMVKIASFSRLCDNTLMWSHYAAKHTGICLGFDFEMMADNKIMVADVRYTDKIEPVFPYKNWGIGLAKWIFTKSSVWSYEQEVRAVIAEKSPYSNFPIAALKSIHFGIKTSKDDIDIFEKILEKFGYILKTKSLMVMDSDNFRVKEKSL